MSFARQKRFEVIREIFGFCHETAKKCYLYYRDLKKIRSDSEKIRVVLGFHYPGGYSVTIRKH